MSLYLSLLIKHKGSNQELPFIELQGKKMFGDNLAEHVVFTDKDIENFFASLPKEPKTHIKNFRKLRNGNLMELSCSQATYTSKKIYKLTDEEERDFLNAQEELERLNKVQETIASLVPEELQTKCDILTAKVRGFEKHLEKLISNF